jgi:hypothetical protein
MSPLRQTDFYHEPKYLKRSHPVTLLRIRFLARRARTIGYNTTAQRIEADWNVVAQATGIEEDYHGFYDNTLEQVVDETLNNMLIETNPRACTEAQAIGGGWVAGTDTPVRLLNWAWQRYRDNREQYTSWETDRITAFLGASG